MEFFNTPGLAEIIPAGLRLGASCGPAPLVPDQQHWFISLISKQGPVTQQEEKHILPVTFESQWAAVCFDTLHRSHNKQEA